MNAVRDSCTADRRQERRLCGSGRHARYGAERVSDFSVRKDTVILRRLYWEAGIPEFWLIDGAENRRSLKSYAARGYLPIRKQDGWLQSKVFGRAFRFNR